MDYILHLFNGLERKWDDVQEKREKENGLMFEIIGT